MLNSSITYIFKLKIVFILLCLYTSFSFSQNKSIDSLNNLLSKETVDVKKLELLEQIVATASNINLKEALIYPRQSVKLVNQIQNKTWQPKFNEMKGRIHANLLELDSASYLFDKALKQKKTNGTIYIEHPAIAVVENMTKAFVSGDSDKVASYLGIENFKAYYQNFITGFSDIKFTVVDILGQGDKIVKHWNFKGKHTGDFFGMPATGKSVDIDGVTIAKMKDGKIAQEQDFMDNTVFMQQLGIVSAPENTGIIDNLYKAFGIGDIPSVLAVLDNNVVWNEAEGNAYADGNPYIGPDAVLNGVFARVGSEWDGLN